MGETWLNNQAISKTPMLCNVSCFEQGHKVGDLIKDGECDSEEFCNLIRCVPILATTGEDSLHWGGVNTVEHNVKESYKLQVGREASDDDGMWAWIWRL